MARSADETARVLIEIYTDSYSYFKINWPDLPRRCFEWVTLLSPMSI